MDYFSIVLELLLYLLCEQKIKTWLSCNFPIHSWRIIVLLVYIAEISNLLQINIENQVDNTADWRVYYREIFSHKAKEHFAKLRILLRREETIVLMDKLKQPVRAVSQCQQARYFIRWFFQNPQEAQTLVRGKISPNTPWFNCSIRAKERRILWLKKENIA